MYQRNVTLDIKSLTFLQLEYTTKSHIFNQPTNQVWFQFQQKLQSSDVSKENSIKKFITRIRNCMQDVHHIIPKWRTSSRRTEQQLFKLLFSLLFFHLLFSVSYSFNSKTWSINDRIIVWQWENTEFLSQKVILGKSLIEKWRVTKSFPVPPPLVKDEQHLGSYHS